MRAEIKVRLHFPALKRSISLSWLEVVCGWAPEPGRALPGVPEPHPRLLPPGELAEPCPPLADHLPHPLWSHCPLRLVSFRDVGLLFTNQTCHGFLKPTCLLDM